MANETSDTTQVKNWLDLMRAGDQQARGRLIEHTCERLRLLTRKMLRDFPRVHRWEETDDVFTEAITKLHQCLATVQPESPRHFYNLAATHIRRVLIDMARHYYGPLGLGAKHETNANQPEGKPPRYEKSDSTGEPSNLMEFAEFYEQIKAFPEEERELVDLIWLQELSQEEAAQVLGISARTVRRRWQEVRFRIGQVMKGDD